MSINFSTSENATISSNLRPDLGVLHSENGAVEIDILAACKFEMKAGSDFKETCDTALDLDPARARLGDPRQDFQQRRFSSTVAPNDADDVTAIEFEGKVFQGPELFDFVTGDQRAASRGV